MRIVLAVMLGLTACDDNQTWVAPTPYEAQAPAELACVPNLDGQITSDELEPAFGVPVSYLVSPSGVTRAIDPTGQVDEAGRRVWDLSAPETDPVISVSARPISEHWAASSFPADAFTTPLDAAHTIDGVYRRETNELLLLGLASRLENPTEGRTLWTYTTPVSVYRFPLTDGARWVSVGEVKNGLVRGLPYAGRDTYEIEVAGAGRLMLPDFTFTQSLRVKTRLVSQPAVGASQARQQISWLFECFGEVARATSQTGEANADFTTATEVRRLGL